jgi:hypothetical protein
MPDVMLYVNGDRIGDLNVRDIEVKMDSDATKVKFIFWDKSTLVVDGVSRTYTSAKDLK